MSLKKYASKRNIKATKEPKAKHFKRKSGNPCFVVHKHAAKRLHYDLRMEVKGVLKSWAIPKGPSLNPNVKRLAILVEDHPYEYRHFEGVIPSGYGAGTVMIWDEGEYCVDENRGRDAEKKIEEGLNKGEVHFTLSGKKLKGDFMLVKLKNKDNEWLLIKKKDNAASKEDITRKDRSVLSNKSMEEIAHNPHLLKPMLATLIDKPFDSNAWLFEIKWDGFRSLAELKNNEVHLYSRNLQSLNQRFPDICESLRNLRLDAVLDGEIVALDEKGICHFQMLQDNDADIYYYVFDLLYFNGKDLRSLPLIERKSILQNILKKNTRIRYLDHIENKGKKFFNLCKKQGLEGIIGKKKESLYESGVRSKNWVKIKTEARQEVIICGFTQPSKSRKYLGALVVGIYRKGILSFAGHVGTGFTEEKLEELKNLLSSYIIKKSPFEHTPQSLSKVTWVKPIFVCEVKFKEWTNEGVMRMPVFMGLRSDKNQKSVLQKEKDALAKYDFITHADKIYWEEEHISKGDLLRYYQSISSYILPYLKNRPENLKRYPNGIDKPSFYQKNVEDYPGWLKTTEISHKGKIVNYMLIQDERSLLYAVNLGCIEIHPWLSGLKNLENPDYLMFDLDPVEVDFDNVVATAREIHQFLETCDIPSFCKTSGGRGLHVGVPLGGKYPFEEAKQFSRLLALLVHQEIPEITSLERSPQKRKGKVYIDCYQNNYGQSLIAPYSVRAKPKAPISTPLEWKEVKKGLDPLEFTLSTIEKRLKKNGDLFKPILQKGIHIEKCLKHLEKDLRGR